MCSLFQNCNFIAKRRCRTTTRNENPQQTASANSRCSRWAIFLRDMFIFTNCGQRVELPIHLSSVPSSFGTLRPQAWSEFQYTWGSSVQGATESLMVQKVQSVFIIRPFRRLEDLLHRLREFGSAAVLLGFSLLHRSQRPQAGYVIGVAGSVATRHRVRAIITRAYKR